jgi:glycosyltransferase involved in cell wall biosynthesis
VAPYLDVKAMAECVLRLSQDNELRQRLGQNAGQKVRQRHDINIVAPQILQVIQRTLNRC